MLMNIMSSAEVMDVEKKVIDRMGSINLWSLGEMYFLLKNELGIGSNEKWKEDSYVEERHDGFITKQQFMKMEREIIKQYGYMDEHIVGELYFKIREYLGLCEFDED